MKIVLLLVHQETLLHCNLILDDFDISVTVVCFVTCEKLTERQASVSCSNSRSEIIPFFINIHTNHISSDIWLQQYFLDKLHCQSIAPGLTCWFSLHHMLTNINGQNVLAAGVPQL